jgi:hypothetical protein
MLQRLLYSVKMAWKCRREIGQIKRSDLANDTITNIQPSLLKIHKISALVLDFDGVMASHGSKYPRSDVEKWLHELILAMPELKLFILSNNPWEVRLKYFQEHFPTLTFVFGVKKKPYPDGMQKVCELAGCNPKEAAIVDDRLLTGCLASHLAGCQAIFIYKPYVNYKQHFVQECFFQFLRHSEKLIY